MKNFDEWVKAVTYMEEIKEWEESGWECPLEALAQANGASRQKN